MSNSGQILHISFGGPIKKIEVSGGVIVFEDHRYLGPVPVDEVSFEEILVSPDHLFWEAVTQWYQAGRPMNPDGTCHWEPEKA